MEYEIREFKPREVPDDFWKTYFEFTEANSRFQNPDDPLPDREAIIQRQKTEFPDFHYKRWLAWTPGGKVVGWAGFGATTQGSDDYEQNKHIGQFNIAVHPEFYREGIGTSFLKIIVKEAQAINRTVLNVGTSQDSGREFLQKHGGKKTLEGAESRLDLTDVDWDLMRSWVEEGKKRAEGVTIESFIECPEEILDDFCEMYTQAANMAPHGEMEYTDKITGDTRRKVEKTAKDMGQTHFTMVSREKDGTISGLTEIFYEPREVYRIRQELTGVRLKYRGRGLGKWLKAQMILHIKENYPEVEMITTGNADVNAPMLSINERMGFKRYRGGEMYKFQTEELAKRLGI